MASKSICLYFQVHQPTRLRLYRFFDIGKDSHYYDDFANRTILRRIAQKCYLPMNGQLLELIKQNKGKFKVAFSISGSALEQFQRFAPEVIDTAVADEARAAGRCLAEIVRAHAVDGVRRAFIMGGETVVKLTGHGKGGRNQEFALAAATVLDGIPNVALVSVGSDGTDGPTDAAGGCVDGATAELLTKKGISIADALAENDSYPTLAAADGLVVTGPTGTNVNDVAIGLVDIAHA